MCSGCSMCLSYVRALLTLLLPALAQSTLYDDYRFVTRPELERLGLTSAIGTSVLRAYMHGACSGVRSLS